MDPLEKKKKKLTTLQWKVHTPNLLKEVLDNKTTSALKLPLSILGNLLEKLAKRAIEINDDELNKIMIRLTLYSISDPESPDYNSKLINEYLEDKPKKNFTIHSLNKKAKEFNIKLVRVPSNSSSYFVWMGITEETNTILDNLREKRNVYLHRFNHQSEEQWNSDLESIVKSIELSK